MFLLIGYIFTDIYIYFAISIVLYAILRPIARFLTNVQMFRFRIPRALAVLMSFAVLSFVIFVFVLLFVPLISEQVKVISTMDYNTISGKLGAPLYNLENFLIANELTDQNAGFIVEGLREQFQHLVSQMDLGIIINEVLSFTGTFFIGFMAVVFITFFLLYEMGPIRKKFISLIANKYFEVTIAALNKIERLLSNYLLGLVFQMTAIFSLASIGLSIVGVKYALSIAMFAAVANIIPYLGPVLGSIFGIIVGVTIAPDLITFRDYFIFITKIVAVFAVVQVSDNMVWQPLIFSKSVKAHPLEIFIVIFAGATLAGIIGMIAAIPVYTVLRVSFTEFFNGYRGYKIFKLQKVKFR